MAPSLPKPLLKRIVLSINRECLSKLVSLEETLCSVRCWSTLSIITDAQHIAALEGRGGLVRCAPEPEPCWIHLAVAC